MIELKPAKVETTYRHKQTGELLRKEKTGSLKVIKKRIGQDVNVVMPSLDFLSKTK